MRSFIKLFALTAIIVLSISGLNAQNFAGPRKPERTIEQQIAGKLINLTHYGVFDHITFHINNGTVTLNGKVNSIGVKDEAKRAISGMPGVTNVVNNIEQLPPSPFDNEIRRKALRTFEDRGPAWYFATPRPEVRIIVENGRITLEGYVSNSSASNTLNILANGISGVFSVQNNLIVGKDTSR